MVALEADGGDAVLDRRGLRHPPPTLLDAVFPSRRPSAPCGNRDARRPPLGVALNRCRRTRSRCRRRRRNRCRAGEAERRQRAEIASEATSFPGRRRIPAGRTRFRSRPIRNSVIGRLRDLDCLWHQFAAAANGPPQTGGAWPPPRPRPGAAAPDACLIRRAAAAARLSRAALLAEQRGELLGHGAGQLLRIDDGDGAAVVAGHVVADADGQQLDRRARPRSAR